MKPEFSYIDTERLSIRLTEDQTLFQIHRHYSDDELMAFYGFQNKADLTAAKAKVDGGMVTYRTRLLMGHLILKGSSIIIGNCALHNWYPLHRRAELGYMMQRKEYKNQGYMKEAVGAIIQYGFEHLNLIRVEALIGPTNIPSLKIIQSYGFKEEGRLRSHWMLPDGPDDSLIFGLLKQEWEQNVKH